jgi:hypothetical protein
MIIKRIDMVTFKSKLSKKEESQIRLMLMDISDPFCEFYITQKNIRLFVRENFDILKSCLTQGDKIVFDDKCFAIVLGFSDNSPRKYVKFLSRDLDSVGALVGSLYLNIKEDLYCKVKNNNPIKDKLIELGFKMVGNRGKESLLMHTYEA